MAVRSSYSPRSWTPKMAQTARPGGPAVRTPIGRYAKALVVVANNSVHCCELAMLDKPKCGPVRGERRRRARGILSSQLLERRLCETHSGDRRSRFYWIAPDAVAARRWAPRACR